MKKIKIYKTYKVIRYEDSNITIYMQDFVHEEPLLIRVEDRPYYLVMRTPGDEMAHAAGFCLSEGLVESGEDIDSIDFCDRFEENNVTVKLSAKRKKMVAEQLGKSGFFGQSSCGICGREMIDDLTENLKVIKKGYTISCNQVYECVEKFFSQQKYYARTRGTHAVMIFNRDFEIISRGEDVGRHNSMDKAIGSLLIENRMPEAYLAVLTSRISFEMMQKAARASIPILISISNPTSMAVEMGKKLNITLICLDKKKSGFIVPCGEKRIIK